MKQPVDLFELHDQPEALLPELDPYVTDGLGGNKMIDHPLVRAMVYTPGRAAVINESYRFKTKAVEEALKGHDFSKYIGLHERPYRIDALSEIENHRGLSDADYWGLVRHVWADSQFPSQRKPEWAFVWRSTRSAPENVMTQEEQEALQVMPDKIKVWRGVSHRSAAKGLSWTTDREKAVWFANRLCRQTAILIEGGVKKENVLAYLPELNESEIVALNVKILTKTDVRRD